MRCAVITLNPRGLEVAHKLRAWLPDTEVFMPARLASGNNGSEIPFASLRDAVKRAVLHHQGIVFVMPAGIVVRLMTPYVRDKHSDPAVVVVDEGGHFAISLLSGHEGGANLLALQVANATGAEPVITTAAEVAKKTVVGIGARRGISQGAVEEAIGGALREVQRPLSSVRWVATIEEKARELGVIAACSALGLPIRVFTRERIGRFRGNYQRSAFVKEKIGVEGVCEPCVLLSGREMNLLLPKRALRGVTVAVGEESSF